MKKKTFVLQSSVFASAIFILAGCGGGGGGGGEAAVAPPAGGAIGGVAAKGFLKHAIVTAYCGNSEAAADKLVTGGTDDAGAYSLKWTTACTKPVKLVASLSTDVTKPTKMADEATGVDVDLPADFKLRALVADPSTTATKHITPFTDMAVAIARDTTSKDAILNAESAIVATVLGGDFNAYHAKPVAPTTAGLAGASADEIKLATLLTAVSARATDDASCSEAGDSGAKIACALTNLSDLAKATVTGVTATGYTTLAPEDGRTPSSVLSATLAKVEDVESTLGKGGPGKEVSVADLKGSGADTLLVTTVTSGTTTIASASGIEAAKALFNSLKTDVAALSNSNKDGFLDQKLSAAQADLSANGHASLTGFLDYLTAINRATQMASDAKTFPAPATSGLIANAAYPVAGHSDLVLITDSLGAAHQYIRYFASFVGPDNQPLGMNCRVNVSDRLLGKAGCFYGYGKANVANLTPLDSFTTFFHGVRVAEGTTTGSFGWQDALASRVFSSFQRYSTPNGAVFVPALQTIATPQGPQTIVIQQNYTTFAIPLADSVNDTAPFAGTVTLTRDPVTTNVTALALAGDIVPLATGQDKSTVAISAALTSTATSQTGNFSGTVINVKGSATTLSMAILPGSQIVSAPATLSTSDHVVSVNFATQMKTTDFQFDGTLVIDTFTADKSGNFQPANASFTGRISTLALGTATEFLNGTLGLKQTNLASFDPGAVTSATNFLAQTATFTGKVTNGATTYLLTFIDDRSVFGTESVTLNYTRNGTQMISFTGTKSATVNTITIHGSGDVNAVLEHEVGEVKIGSTVVGVISKNPSMVDFSDGTFLLLGT